MNPTINLMNRMLLLSRQQMDPVTGETDSPAQRALRKGRSMWDPTAICLPAYLNEIGHVIKDKVVLDIGCGSGRLWIDADARTFRKYYGVDVVRWKHWPEFARKNPLLAFLQGEVNVMLPESHKPPPEVALIKNVLEWNTFADIRRMLFSIPVSVKRTVITYLDGDEYAASPLHPPFRTFSLAHPTLQLPILQYRRWHDADSICGQMSVIVDNLAAWRVKQMKSAIWEPCPSCYTWNEPQYAQLDREQFEVMCMSCGYSTTGPVDRVLSLHETARSVWNSKIIFGYSNPEQ